MEKKEAIHDTKPPAAQMIMIKNKHLMLFWWEKTKTQSSFKMFWCQTNKINNNKMGLIKAVYIHMFS